MRHNSREFLKEIVLRAGDFGPIPEYLSAVRIVDIDASDSVKVRAYASEREAEQQQVLLDRLAGKINYPELLGRWRQYLIFRFLEIQTQGSEDLERHIYSYIGKFLAILNSEEEHNTSLKDLDDEFFTWLERLRAMRMIPAQTAQKARSHYIQTRPPNFPVNLDYWDAMPHNFGLADRTVYLLDEKHIRPSYPGVGLIKPSFIFTPQQWREVRAGYQSVTSLRLFDEHQPFLEFYYLVVALHFYSLIAEAGRVTLDRNARFLHYRDLLIRQVSAGDWLDHLLGEFQLFTNYPAQIPTYVRRRASAFRARLRGPRL
jgi:hypothetical protein